MKRICQIITYINTHPLASKHKLKAYFNFFYWQITQLLKPHSVEVSFVENTKLFVKKGQTGATGNIYTGLHEFSDMGFLLHFLNYEDIFFDVGANVGSYTILASGVKGSKSVSFEPIPTTFEWLKKNIEINHLASTVRAYNIGVGSIESNLFFTKQFDTVNHVVNEKESINKDDLIKVPIKTLDSIADNEGIPILIKIDVEGFETEVLNGMNKTLISNHLKAIIIELNGSGNRYGFDEQLIHNKLRENNFEPYSYNPFSRKLELLNHYGNLNTIYIRDIDFVKSRVENSEKIKVFSEYL